MELPERTQPPLPRPDPLELEEVTWLSVREGDPSPITGFALSIPDYVASLNNTSETRRWVVEALARLQEYEKRSTSEPAPDE